MRLEVGIARMFTARTVGQMQPYGPAPSRAPFAPSATSAGDNAPRRLRHPGHPHGCAVARRVWKVPGLPSALLRADRHDLHGTKISIRTWLFVIFEFCASNKPIRTWEMSHK
jgi:hypothetical protein